MSGDWRIVGTIPGTGTFEGARSVTAEGGDTYGVTEEFTLAGGASGIGGGAAILYTGYE